LGLALWCTAHVAAAAAASVYFAGGEMQRMTVCCRLQALPLIVLAVA
jgi:hypothetical protein